MKFKFFSHTADIKFRSYGNNLDEAFENSVYALIYSVCHEKIKSEKKINIKVKGSDLSNLLYNFLEEILFLIDSKGFLVSKFSKFKLDRKNFTISSELEGDSGKNYEIYSHIKAVTYNEMLIKKIKEKWIIQVVLDV